MKVLTVYTSQGYSKFRGIYDKYIYEIKDQLLHIYVVEPITHQEKLWAVYKDWTHLELDNDGA